MDSIGAEVGQKMRSAIKAKLMELDCYVDDELPDYIMVMVANKRTKSQMNDDLSLFLATKTSTFVNWLHIVLKKLKEVTVTNSEVYKRVSKRKSEELPDIKLKKEKKDKKIKKEERVEDSKPKMKQEKSLTDDLPMTANTLSERRKIVLLIGDKGVSEDNFDIPLLSEVNNSNEKELEEIEQKIKSVKNRLGLLVESDAEVDAACVEKTTVEMADSRKISILDKEITDSQTRELEKGSESKNQEPVIERKQEHKRIVFEELKKPSVHERLGKRNGDLPDKDEGKRRNFSDNYKDRDNRSRSRESKARNSFRRRESSRDRRDTSRDREDRSRGRLRSRERNINRETKKESLLKRLGVMSKVSVPPRTIASEEEEEKEVVREVPSLIKVKPRIIPADVPQPNKNLLLKAVADAQRSVAQTPTVGNNLKAAGLFTKKYRQKGGEDKTTARKLPEDEKRKLKNLIRQSVQNKTHDSDNYDSEGEYIPKPVIKRIPTEVPEYVPSSKKAKDTSDEKEKSKREVVLTLDEKPVEKKQSAKSRLEGRKTPSPIIFNKNDNLSSTVASTKPDIPDKLPIVHPPLSIKNKERCKYWPGCRQGDKCEFVHPSVNCEAFPQCKFGDRCLYLHPKCKFGSSCTKKDCPYDHNFTKSLAVGIVQNCKFFPNCTNPKCQFFHPKLCKYGMYCKNMDECLFSHRFAKVTSLSWRSK